ncbi:hypothetical protein ThidrDRAFT_3751 [Thiorhodococcus drewsii AZ1]|uniref:Uncharacterized protein n=1 Tax=Thiorhodococcus drewsii AZ1 TaxID=765913 RepID=G2E638_9GAMM|nr:hypothetical protein [Thiorhodococcus drewsii]EGV28455.1 hypothetical protein ThidrDRAFT_3751 [Thiorhodococcus drewsii AZ1]
MNGTRTPARRDSPPGTDATPSRLALALLPCLVFSLPVQGEAVFSGFATLGGAISDQDFIYQRFVDNRGTVNRDWLLGLQLEAPITDAWSLTNSKRVPGSLPNADDINAIQTLRADLLGALDQQSLALGTAYRLSATSMLKAEWMQVRTGRVSSFLDAPAGEDSGGRQVNVLALSYSLAF